MNGDTSHSEDAALRRLLRELGTVAPPANFDAQLRARLKRERPPRSDLFSADSLVPRFAAIACAALIMFVAIHALRNSGALDVVSSGSNRILLASNVPAIVEMENFDAATGAVQNASHVATANDPRAIAATVGVTKRFARRSVESRVTDRAANASRVYMRSADAPDLTASAELPARDDGIIVHLDPDQSPETSAAITVHVQSVSGMSRASASELATLVLNPVSFGGEPLASVAASPATRRIAALALTDASERETQSAW